MHTPRNVEMPEQTCLAKRYHRYTVNGKFCSRVKVQVHCPMNQRKRPTEHAWYQIWKGTNIQGILIVLQRRISRAPTWPKPWGHNFLRTDIQPHINKQRYSINVSMELKAVGVSKTCLLGFKSLMMHKIPLRDEALVNASAIGAEPTLFLVCSKRTIWNLWTMPVAGSFCCRSTNH